jgi:hypothetical protein
MGLFWDLYQQGQISEQVERTGSLESRVQALERELRRTRELLQEALLRLERHVGQDLNDDGKIGRTP